MPTYRIAPTDLTFGFQCKFCFRAKVVDGWRAPKQPFPSIFRAMDTEMGRIYGDMPTAAVFRDLHPQFPNGVFGTKQVSLKSSPIKLSDDIAVVFSGRTDCLIEHNPYSASVVDNKLSSITEMGIYERQLWAYTQCLTTPAKGNAKEVKAIVIVANELKSGGSYFHIQAEAGKDGGTKFINRYSFRENIDWRLMDESQWDAWDTFLTDELLPVLQYPQPMTEDCPMCALRYYQQTLQPMVEA